MEGEIDMAARRQAANKLRTRYREVWKADKGRILDEVVETTGPEHGHQPSPMRPCGFCLALPQAGRSFEGHDAPAFTERVYTTHVDLHAARQATPLETIFAQ